jgi:hypothetical protein
MNPREDNGVHREKDLSMKISEIVWDYSLTEVEFLRILRDEYAEGRLDREWAVRRLIEYGDYKDIIRLIGYQELESGWPHWRNGIRSVSRKRGLDFLVSWIRAHRPDLLTAHE